MKIYELTEQKENLLKDITDLNAIIQDVKQEKNQMEVKFENELGTLNSDLKYLKIRNDELTFAMEQAEVEKVQ